MPAFQSLIKSPVINVQAAAVKTPGNESGKDYITALLRQAIGKTKKDIRWMSFFLAPPTGVEPMTNP